MLHHTNTPDCAKCNELLDKYPGFYEPLKQWLLRFRQKHPETHISCAGRNQEDQELACQSGTSKAHWTQSSHNWNCALDFFENLPKDPRGIYDRTWFDTVLAPELETAKDFGIELSWYGRPHAPYFELPHVEPKNWKELAAQGKIKLVA